ncbi:MAG: Serine/threonine exchanger SteT [Haliscomenobacter sp.]|nr:Serine/threonine exchanger SteT [Haliscomenobacter sp.]
MAEDKQPYKIATVTGGAIVVANMIGTGAFTSLGFQLKDLNNASAVLTLWVVGGVLALSGAFSYAEVGTVIKKSGGEYTFLSKIYHPVAGYLSGWISLTVGFAAPIALSSIAFVEYFPVEGLNPTWTSLGLTGLVTFIHAQNLKASSRFQNLSTALKVGLILALLLAGVFLPGESGNRLVFGPDYVAELGSAAFAVALIYVSYSYSGWNAAAYITEEFKNPAKSLPRALVGGTLLVTILYTTLQFVFLKHVPAGELMGQLNVGTLAAEKMLGQDVGRVFGLLISLLLVSGISAMVWVGPRVTSSIAREHALWRFFATGSDGIPKRALWLQFGISAFLIITGTFEQIMIYCGILLTVSTMLVVSGVFILRRKEAHRLTGGYKSPFFPFFQLVFLIGSLWMIVFAFVNNTQETLIGLTNLAVGLGTYFASEKMRISKT